MFNDPAIFTKLAANPKTAPFLADTEFVAKLNRVRANPDLVKDELRDPRIMQVIAVLLGITMDMSATDDAAAAAQNFQNARVEEDTEMADTPKACPPKYEQPAPSAEDEEARAKKEAKEAADKEKEIGTQNYKQRKFDVAIEHYTKAWELFKDITYLNNIAAAKFEAGDFEGCIKECEKAIEEGREMRADFKLVAKYEPPFSCAFFDLTIAGPLDVSEPRTRSRATWPRPSSTTTTRSPSTALPTS